MMYKPCLGAHLSNPPTKKYRCVNCEKLNKVGIQLYNEIIANLDRLQSKVIFKTSSHVLKVHTKECIGKMIRCLCFVLKYLLVGNEARWEKC